MDEHFGSKSFLQLWEQKFSWVCISVKCGLILFLVFLCTDLGVAVQGKAHWDLLSWIPSFRAALRYSYQERF